MRAKGESAEREGCLRVLQREEEELDAVVEGEAEMWGREHSAKGNYFGKNIYKIGSKTTDFKKLSSREF